MIDKYWAAYTDEIDGFVDSSMVAGRPGRSTSACPRLDAPVDAVVPSEGMTGLGRHVDAVHVAPHPNCMLEWMQYTMQPDVQARSPIVRRGGQQHEACDDLRKRLDKAYGGTPRGRHRRYGYCGDEEFLNSIYLWKTPQADLR